MATTVPQHEHGGTTESVRTLNTSAVARDLCHLPLHSDISEEGSGHAEVAHQVATRNLLTC